MAKVVSLADVARLARGGARITPSYARDVQGLQAALAQTRAELQALAVRPQPEPLPPINDVEDVSYDERGFLRIKLRGGKTFEARVRGTTTVVQSGEGATAGGVTQKIIEVSSSRSITATECDKAAVVLIVVDSTSAPVTVTLPAAAALVDKQVFIKRASGGTNDVVIDAPIDDRLTTTILQQNVTLQLIPGATQYYLVSDM